jgi:exodeoxyribonuclease V alpha subunit
VSLIDELFRSGTLRVLDHALAQSLRRLDPATPDEVLAAAALASFAVGQGNAAFDPVQPQLLFDAAIDWPAPQAWLEALSQSRWVGMPDASSSASSDTPLVLENGLLYLRRYRQYEYRLALRLRQIAARVPDTGDLAALAPLFAALFPEASGGDDHQAHAAASALLRSLLLVTGGPGTGKTTTIARLLLLLVAQAQREGGSLPRIALAAPTGRAAERMAESLRAAVSVLRQTPGVDAERCGLARDPFGGSNRIVHGGGEFVLGRQPVIDRDETAAGRMCQRRRDAVMRGDAAGNEPAAVKEHEAGRAISGACR